MSTISIGSETKKKLAQRKLSNPEIVYSSSSQNSAYRTVKKRNRMLNHAGQFISSSHSSAGGEVRQRIMSAQMLKLKQLQNKLGDAQIHINELTNENRLLKQLQKKQDSALNKYENSKSELPQLLRSHDEDVRIWQNKCRHFKEQWKDVSTKLKEKEQEIITLTDQYRHLQSLSTDRNLGEREQLSTQVRELQERIAQQDNMIAVLQRKLALETKNVRAQLTTETNRHKETKKELELVSAEVTRLLSVVESREKYIASNHSRFNSRIEKSTLSMNQLTMSDHSGTINQSKISEAMIHTETKVRNNFLAEIESSNVFRDSSQGSDTSTSREKNRRTLKRRIWAEPPVVSSSCSNESTNSTKLTPLKPIAKAKTGSVANNKLANNKDKLLLDIKKGISELVIENNVKALDDHKEKEVELEKSPDNEILDEVKKFEEMFKAKEDLSVEQRIELMKKEMRDKISQDTLHENIEFSNINSTDPENSSPYDILPKIANTSVSSDESQNDQLSEDSNEEFDDEDVYTELINPNETLKELTNSWKSIENEISVECHKSEAMLEAHCEKSNEDLDDSIYTPKSADNSKTTIKSNKQNIDPEKKKNLLEALKRIDNDKKTFK